MRPLAKTRRAPLCKLNRSDAKGPNVRLGVIPFPLNELGCHPARLHEWYEHSSRRMADTA